MMSERRKRGSERRGGDWRGLFALARGFTLVELVIVIVIIGIVAAVAGIFIQHPIQGYVDLARRTELVDHAEMSLRQMGRDIRGALPHSVRTAGGGTVIEIINTVAGGRYRADPPPGDPDRRLQFNLADTDFNVLGGFSNYPGSVPAGARLVVYNLGIPGADAYEEANVITPAGTAITVTSDTGDHHVDLNPGFQFSFSSPNQRIFLVDGPIAYLCDPADGRLKRYAGHALMTVQPSAPGDFGVGASIVSSHLDCGDTTFTYVPGTSERAGLVTLRLTLTDGGETISLLHQVHVDNVP